MANGHLNDANRVPAVSQDEHIPRLLCRLRLRQPHRYHKPRHTGNTVPFFPNDSNCKNTNTITYWREVIDFAREYFQTVVILMPTLQKPVHCEKSIFFNVKSVKITRRSVLYLQHITVKLGVVSWHHVLN